MNNPLSILWRCLSGIAGLLAGGFFGMAALQLLMLLVGSDFGLSNVRPGFNSRCSNRLSVRRLFTSEEDLVLD